MKENCFTVAPVDMPGKTLFFEALTEVNERLMCSLAWISIIPL